MQIITVQQVIDAMKAWQRANDVAVTLGKYPLADGQIAQLWAEEEAALNHYTKIYNAYHTQGATPDGTASDQNHTPLGA